jgi:hypothetical protein
VAEHYPKLGFEPAGDDGTGRTAWSIATGADIPAAPMEVDRSAFALTPA